MNRWDNDVQLLGTEILKITWKKIERSLIDVEVKEPFLFHLKLKTRKVRECITECNLCKAGYVEYENE